MALFQTGTGYRDPNKAMTIKALQERQKAAAAATEQASAMPAQIASPWQGAAYLGNILGSSVQQGRADAAEADARDRLSQIIAGVDPDKGMTPEQYAQARSLDPEMADRQYEAAMAERRADENRRETQAFTTSEREAGNAFTSSERVGGQDFTAGQNDLSRQATAAENDLNRQATLANQKLQDANADGRQDDAQAAAQELARINAQLDAIKADTAEQAKVTAIGTETDAKVAEAKKLGLVEGSPEYQKYVYDISPSAATNIVTNVGGGKKLDETLDTEEGKIWSGHQRERNVAAGSQKDMAMLDELTKMAPQGPIMGNLASIPYLKGFSNAGVAFSSIVKRVAPTLRVEGSGSTSDIEYQGMLDSLPALGNYPEANRLIIGMMQAKSAINIERGNTVDAYRNGEITDIQARQKLAEINSRSISNPELEALFQKIGPTVTDTGGTDTGDGGWVVEDD